MDNGWSFSKHAFGDDRAVVERGQAMVCSQVHIMVTNVTYASMSRHGRQAIAVAIRVPPPPPPVSRRGPPPVKFRSQ